MKSLEAPTRQGGRGRGRAPDPRFGARKTDARFVPAKHAAPAAVDHKRLAALKADPRFKQAKVDIRGRQIARESEGEDEDEDEEETDESEEEEGEEGEEEEYEEVEEYATEDGSLPDEELAALDEDAAAWSGSDVDAIAATKRVAIVKCDWDHVRPADLFAIFFHHLPLGGRLLDVTLYLSDFGSEQLQFEGKHGPDLWLKPGEGEVQDVQPADPSPDNDDDDDADEWSNDDFAVTTDVTKEGEKFSSGKFRQYEMNRMKYFYAVASFDSAATAAAVYASCDGMDVEASGVVLDLRYVPVEETFDPSRVRAKVEKLPSNFRPLKPFKAAALTQSRFRISWDQDDPTRTQSLRDAFTDETEEADLMAYLASDSDDELNDDEDHGDDQRTRRDTKRRAIRSKYASLLDEIGGVVDDLPDMPEDGDGDTQDGLDSGVESLDSGSDDDELNDFDGVSFGSGEELEEADGSDDGNKEMSFDMAAGDKARSVATQMMRDRAMDGATLGEQQQQKYKLRRREAKRGKKEMLVQREAELDAELETRREERKALIQERLGESALPQQEPRKSLKERRKALASAKKAEQRASREELKKRRTLVALGVKKTQAAEVEPDAIDDRFAGRLLNDPRFHVDRNSERHAKDPAVAKLASAVQAARRTPARAPAAQADDSGAAVDFFVKRQKRSRS